MALPEVRSTWFLAHGRAWALAGSLLALTIGAEPAAGSSTWEYELTPYAWAAGLDGSVRLTARESGGIGVEQSFSDILDRLDLGLMGAFEARRGRWGVLVDGVYFRVSDRGGVSGRLGVLELFGDATVTQQVYALAGTYRALDEGAQVIDLVGGVRHTSVAWDVKLDLSLPLPPDVTRRIKTTERWVDPYLGARVQRELSGRWSLVGYADVGGFGIGSDFSWQLLAGANYTFKPNVIGKLGYRHVDMDYDDDGFAYDMASSGVYVGLGVRW